jgi:predicted nucleic acid-binding protein
MIAFDTDVLTEILLGDPTFVAHAVTIPPHEQAVPVVVIEEIMRGRLQVIRQAEAGQARVACPVPTTCLSRRSGISNR